MKEKKEIVNPPEKWTAILRVFDFTREWTVSATAVALTHYRNALVVYFIAGACACVFAAKTLKVLIRQQRPSSVRSSQKESYGMPSTHSAAMTYYSVSISYIVLGGGLADENGYVRRDGSPATSKRISQAIVVVLVSAVGLLAALSRALNGHHSMNQVLAGVCLGVVFAAAWWYLRSLLILPIDKAIELLTTTPHHV